MSSANLVANGRNRPEADAQLGGRNSRRSCLTGGLVAFLKILSDVGVVRRTPSAETHCASLDYDGIMGVRIIKECPDRHTMESLKPINEVTEPDVRNTYFVVRDATTETRKLTLADIHEAAGQIVLHNGVPEHIRNHFAQAQNLTVYSWFFYPFNVTAQFMAFVTVEFALKHRLNSTASFTHLIRRAVGEGLIRDEGFAIARHGLPSEQKYVETLAEVMPKLRNELAHGSNMLHNNSLSSLRICAEFINQLYVQHVPASPAVQGGPRNKAAPRPLFLSIGYYEIHHCHAACCCDRHIVDRCVSND